MQKKNKNKTKASENLKSGSENAISKIYDLYHFVTI